MRQTRLKISTRRRIHTRKKAAWCEPSSDPLCPNPSSAISQLSDLGLRFLIITPFQGAIMQVLIILAQCLAHSKYSVNGKWDYWNDSVERGATRAQSWPNLSFYRSRKEATYPTFPSQEAVSSGTRTQDPDSQVRAVPTTTPNTASHFDLPMTLRPRVAIVSYVICILTALISSTSSSLLVHPHPSRTGLPTAPQTHRSSSCLLVLVKVLVFSL